MKTKLTYGVIWVIIAVVIFTLANVVYKNTLWLNDLEEHAPLLRELLSIQDTVEVLYLGDCSDVTYSDKDSSKQSVSELLPTYFPKSSIRGISHDGADAKIFRLLLENVSDESSIHTVIITLNLRTFSPNALYSNYRDAFHKSESMMESRPALINRLLLGFGHYEHIPEDERETKMQQEFDNEGLQFPYPFEYSTTGLWDRSMADGGWKNSDGSWDQKTIDEACYSIKDFAIIIDEQHELTKELDKTVKLAKRRGWKLLFNLLPENTEQTKSLAGSDLNFLIYQNRDFLKNRYSNEGVMVIDNLELLHDREFIEEGPNEHYTLSGRLKLASAIADKLNDALPPQQRANEDSWHVNHFEVQATSNLEGPFWTNNSSLTQEEAHSGQFSSKINAANPFSITYVHPLDTTVLIGGKSISVEFYSLCRLPNPNFKLVVEIEQTKREKFWGDKKLNESSTLKPGVWQRHQLLFPIPEHVKQPTGLKVYVLNTSEIDLFIDDIAVKW